MIYNLQSLFLILTFCIVVLSNPITSQKPGSAYSKKFLSKSSKTRFNIKNVKNIITFGDSYTSSLVNYDTMEPVRDSTTSSGPNWIFYLSDILNSTSTKNDIKIYNFASGGASVTKEISPVYSDEVNTFTKQVRELFKPKMVDVKDQFPWNSKNSLFGIWFGINDTGNRKITDDLSNEDYEAMTFLMYFRLLDELYQSGARNFLIINIPDLQYAPFVVSNGDD
ncbi:carbohydrate esterase family 16 protein, partial [Piromyces sp. E2]